LTLAVPLVSSRARPPPVWVPAMRSHVWAVPTQIVVPSTATARTSSDGSPPAVFALVYVNQTSSALLGVSLSNSTDSPPSVASQTRPSVPTAMSRTVLPPIGSCGRRYCTLLPSRHRTSPPARAPAQSTSTSQARERMSLPWANVVHAPWGSGLAVPCAPTDAVDRANATLATSPNAVRPAAMRWAVDRL
jgi:hypothetical protein